MSQDRITQLRIAGLRSIENLTLDLNGLTVLIGDNGTGKSTIIEALEILRQSSRTVSHIPDVIIRSHGGLDSLLRTGAKSLRLSLKIEGDGPALEYGFTVANMGNSPTIVEEFANAYLDPAAAEPLHTLIRNPTKTLIYSHRANGLVTLASQEAEGAGGPLNIGNHQLVLPWIAVTGHPSLRRIAEALENIKVHVPFETRPLWQQKELSIAVGPRWPDMIDQSDSLSRYALNLANIYQHLRNQGGEVWQRVVTSARFGLGDDLRDFQLTPAGRGNIELQVVFGHSPNHPLPAEVLSEGQIAFLAFIALVELPAGRSLLTFDEPELHLHPALLARVVWMLEEAAEKSPVILCTHSDRLLDALGDPAKSVVLCELDEKRSTRLRRPDREKLAQWLEDYRGFGSLRAEGYEQHVFHESIVAEGNQS